MVHVVAAHELAAGAEQGEDAGRHRALLAPLAGAEDDPLLQQRHLLAQRRGVQCHAVVEMVEDGLRCGLHPGGAVCCDACLGDVLGESAELCGGHARRRAAPGRRQEVAGEGEQGAAHRQLLHQQPGVVEHGVDVGDAQPVHPCLQGEVDGGRLGRVQDGHGAGGAHRIGVAVLGVDPVAPGESRPALRVWNVLHRAMIAHRHAPGKYQGLIELPPGAQ